MNLVRLPTDESVIVDLARLSTLFCDDTYAEGDVVFPTVEGTVRLAVTLVGQWTVWAVVGDTALPWSHHDNRESALLEMSQLANRASWGKAQLGGFEDGS